MSNFQYYAFYDELEKIASKEEKEKKYPLSRAMTRPSGRALLAGGVAGGLGGLGARMSGKAAEEVIPALRKELDDLKQFNASRGKPHVAPDESLVRRIEKLTNKLSRKRILAAAGKNAKTVGAGVGLTAGLGVYLKQRYNRKVQGRAFKGRAVRGKGFSKGEKKRFGAVEKTSAKKDKEKTYPVSRALTNPGARGSLAGGFVGGTALGGVGISIQEMTDKAKEVLRHPSGFSPGQIEKAKKFMKYRGRLKAIGVAGAALAGGVVGGVTYARHKYRRAIHNRALKSRLRKRKSLTFEEQLMFPKKKTSGFEGLGVKVLKGAAKKAKKVSETSKAAKILNSTDEEILRSQPSIKDLELMGFWPKNIGSDILRHSKKSGEALNRALGSK